MLTSPWILCLIVEGIRRHRIKGASEGLNEADEVCQVIVLGPSLTSSLTFRYDIMIVFGICSATSKINKTRYHTHMSG